jgi:hypothetical protein
MIFSVYDRTGDEITLDEVEQITIGGDGAGRRDGLKYDLFAVR